MANLYTLTVVLGLLVPPWLAIADVVALMVFAGLRWR